MTLRWTVRFQALVYPEDLRKINYIDQQKILKAIETKLTVDPVNYSRPLTAQLKGYWRLRVMDYRVIYRISKNIVEVLIIKIGPRKDGLVYDECLLRIKKLGSIRHW